MAHRAKHRRANWVPERLAKAEERAKIEQARQDAHPQQEPFSV